MDAPIYKLSDVAAAAGIAPEVLKNWTDRGVIKLGEFDIAGGGRGRHRLFTQRRALQVAVTAGLVRLGLQPAEAAKAAWEWTDEYQDWSDVQGAPWDEGVQRADGQLLFDDGLTVMAVYPNASFAIVRNVKIPKDHREPSTHAFDLFASPNGFSEGVVMLTLNPIMDRVRKTLEGEGDR